MKGGKKEELGSMEKAVPLFPSDFYRRIWASNPCKFHESYRAWLIHERERERKFHAPRSCREIDRRSGFCMNEDTSRRLRRLWIKRDVYILNKRNRERRSATCPWTTMCNRWHLPARVVISPCTLIILTKCTDQASLLYDKMSLFSPRVSQQAINRQLFIYIYTFSGARTEKKNEANSTWFPSSFVSFPLFFFFPPSSAVRNEKNFYFQAFHQITGGTVYYRFPANKRSWFKSPSSPALIFFFFSPWLS